MFPTLSKLLILVKFKINQDYIAKVLCENRNKPVLACEGTCFLSDQLKEQEVPTSDCQLPPFPVEKLQPLFITHTTSDFYNQAFVIQERLDLSSFYAVNYSLEYSLSLFKPPQHTFFTSIS